MPNEAALPNLARAGRQGAGGATSMGNSLRPTPTRAASRASWPGGRWALVPIWAAGLRRLGGRIRVSHDSELSIQPD
eukprot:365169-Alexandrium_andersonii.AAC.1